MGKYQEEKKTPIIMVKKRRTLLPPSLSEKNRCYRTFRDRKDGRISL